MVIEPKHVGALLMQILIFFLSNSIVHQLVNKRLWLPVLLSLIPMLTLASQGFRIKHILEIRVLRELQPFCGEIMFYVVLRMS
jgi:hypothetical protein